MKHLLVVLILIVGAITVKAGARPKRLAQAIERLDRAIAKRDIYSAAQKARVDSMKSLLDTVAPCRVPELMRLIGREYRRFDADSAHHYFAMSYEKAVECGNEAEAAHVLIDHADQLSRKMLYGDAVRMLDSIDISILDRYARIDYYSALSRALQGAATIYSFHAGHQALYDRAKEALDSLAAQFPVDSREQRLARAQIHYMNGNNTLGAGELIEVFDVIDPDYPGYAIVTGMLAHYYKDNITKRDEYLYYLTLSAISDVMTANGEPASIVTLAGELFKDGEIDRAYEYVSAASEAINSSKSTLLSNDLLESVSMVNDTLRKQENAVKRNYGLGFLALVVVMAAATAFAVRERRRCAALRDRICSLNDSVTSREVYINQLLDICAVYVEGVEDFNRLVGRKLKAGQAKDLLNTIESGKIIQEQTDRFFTVFDSAVLRIFPNFTSELNKLLRPDKQIAQPSTGEKLTPEQRIIAFMRLGVSDSTRISKFLGLSLNTVYTYRNRIKSRAIDRDNFEKNIMNIQK
ncbi:MAG: DUF6377 domain-containing protein [Odoribacter sp.]|nr:DUF6377 domain-containing protein [Odoribacter sp.]